MLLRACTCAHVRARAGARFGVSYAPRAPRATRSRTRSTWATSTPLDEKFIVFHNFIVVHNLLDYIKFSVIKLY